MKLSRLLQEMPILGPRPTGDPDITSVEYDSRRVVPGSLFFALPGSVADGADFLQAAADAGAAVAVSGADVPVSPLPFIKVENPRASMAQAAAIFNGKPSSRLKVVGVTGTNGKTTTTYLVKHLLDDAARMCGLLGTIHYSIGRQEMPAARTTPESPEVQSLMAAMVDSGCKSCAMEVSSHALVQHRADAIDFDVAVFTNLTQDHLDYHGDMEGYFRAKSLLFEKLKYSAKKGVRAVINGDDRFGHQLVSKFGKDLETISFGLNAGADFRAKNIRFQASGTTFALVAKGREYLVQLPLIGLFNVYNALAAIAAVSSLGVGVREVVASLAKAPQVPGRLQRVPAKRSFQVFVDYAHTPDALLNVLRTVRELMPERILTVFGCGGDRDKSKRPMMGAAAEQLSDYLIVTSDNPRGENPAAILADIEKGFRGDGYEICEDRAAAIRRAVDLAMPGDIVLIAGKGHENYQEVAGRKEPFDDVQVATWAIAEKPVEER